MTYFIDDPANPMLGEADFSVEMKIEGTSVRRHKWVFVDVTLDMVAVREVWRYLEEHLYPGYGSIPKDFEPHFTVGVFEECNEEVAKQIEMILKDWRNDLDFDGTYSCSVAVGEVGSYGTVIAK